MVVTEAKMEYRRSFVNEITLHFGLKRETVYRGIAE